MEFVDLTIHKPKYEYKIQVESGYGGCATYIVKTESNMSKALDEFKEYLIETNDYFYDGFIIKSIKLYEAKK